ncbi:P-loop NTPase fold protein [Actinokineospora sp. NBRC 105648]|uniref:P-loop NTPase fold protein n=1 Tax=Actinokineospora sp. NBRC 105648 TaxID=3032206 RepID=UPI0024A01C4A|nr:P-loop NTPase fold protein [Actinokineospora sp. NBRC 105648]GLZ43358.1 hypothetical protein Acsp05_69820 [Actinokineospora sp. NBRC 105648]
MTDPRTDHRLCPICFDEIRWDESEPLEYDEGLGRFLPATSSTPARGEQYLQCPNPSADRPVHFLPIAYGEFDRPLLIGLVGRPQAGKTTLLAAMASQLLSGGLRRLGFLVEPFSLHQFRQYTRDKIDPYQSGLRLPGEPVDKDLPDVGFVLRNSETKRLVLFYDPQGESLGSGSSTGFSANAFLASADGLLFVEPADLLAPATAAQAGGVHHWSTSPFTEALDRSSGRKLAAAFVLGNADLLRRHAEVAQWLAVPQESGAISADRFATEGRAVHRVLRRLHADRSLFDLYHQFDRCTYHFVSATGSPPESGRFEQVAPARVLQPLVALLCMLGVIEGPEAQRVGRKPPDISTIRVDGDRPHSGVLSDAANSVDGLGIGPDVETMATLLAAKSTALPLSVALLGDWGMGKSSFMAQVADRVDRLAEASTEDSRGSAFVARVKQVRFNAWHYSDDHLWTGLIEHLLREISSGPDKPPTGDRAALRTRLRDAQKSAKQLKDDLKRVDDIEVGGWLGSLNQPFRARRLLRAAGVDIWREARRGRSIWLGLALLVVGAVAVVLGVVYGQALLGIVGGVVVAATGLAAPVTAAAKRAHGLADDLHGKLVKQAAARDKAVADLERALGEVDPLQRLTNLMAEVGKAGRYEAFRGLTGRIHHDLDALDRQLQAARRDWETEDTSDSPPLQRVILYVDDLDRCRPDRVVEVLQAVNLLLSMSLFAVVVAVDPPWLLRALEDHYGNKLLTAGPIADSGQRRALDYLDKIFHIAYALRPPNKDQAETYLRGLLPLPPAAELPVPEDQPEEAGLPPTPTSAPRAAASRQAAPRRETPAAARSQHDLSELTLSLTEAEYDFLPGLRVLLPTPRAMKKLANLYRLLRISVHDRLDDFVGTGDTGPYQAAALLLAIVVGMPTEARAILITLRSEPASSDIYDVIGTTGALADWFDATPRAPRTVALYQEWAPQVARYGFETYHLFDAD